MKNKRLEIKEKELISFLENIIINGVDITDLKQEYKNRLYERLDSEHAGNYIVMINDLQGARQEIGKSSEIIIDALKELKHESTQYHCITTHMIAINLLKIIYWLQKGFEYVNKEDVK